MYDEGTAILFKKRQRRETFIALNSVFFIDNTNFRISILLEVTWIFYVRCVSDTLVFLILELNINSLLGKNIKTKSSKLFF